MPCIFSSSNLYVSIQMIRIPLIDYQVFVSIDHQVFRLIEWIDFESNSALVILLQFFRNTN